MNRAILCLLPLLLAAAPAPPIESLSLHQEIAVAQDARARESWSEAAAALARAQSHYARPDPLLAYDQAVCAYRAGDFLQAATAFEQATHTSDPALASAASYNLGNAQAQVAASKESPKDSAAEYRKALDAYRHAIRSLDQTIQDRAMANGELVMQRLQEEEQKQEQEQDQEQQNQDKQEQSEEQQEQQQQEQQQEQSEEQQQQQEQDQEQQNQDKQEQSEEQHRAAAAARAVRRTTRHSSKSKSKSSPKNNKISSRISPKNSSHNKRTNPNRNSPKHNKNKRNSLSSKNNRHLRNPQKKNKHRQAAVTPNKRPTRCRKKKPSGCCRPFGIANVHADRPAKRLRQRARPPLERTGSGCFSTHISATHGN